METAPNVKERESVLKEVNAIASGPLPLRMAMEICVRCGNCAKHCPVYQGKPDSRYNPTLRTDRLRALYKRHNTLAGKYLGALAGASDYREGEINGWAESFYECTGCRRCASFCPMGLDHSIVTRKGRAVVHKLGLTPKRLLDITHVSLKTGNTDGCTVAGFLDTVKFLEEEMKEETGLDIPIPVDKVGAEIFFVPPSGDVLVKPEALMGIAKIFYQLGADWTMCTQMFDGANYGLFTGDDQSMKEETQRCITEAKKLKSKVFMMGECGHAYRVMKFMMEKQNWHGKLPFDITNVMLYTSDLLKKGRIRLDSSKNAHAVTYHDPCNFTRSCEIIEEPRAILREACQDFREMTPNRAQNWCCGGGGGLSAMDSIHNFRMTVSGKKKIGQIRETGAVFVAAPCANCKRQLTQLMEYYKVNVEVGGVHDLINRAIELTPKGVTEDGYLAEGTSWDPKLAELIARKNDLWPLTEDHWKVLNCVREGYLDSRKSPGISNVHKKTGLSAQRIAELFPGGIDREAHRIAGLPRDAAGN